MFLTNLNSKKLHILNICHNFAVSIEKFISIHPLIHFTTMVQALVLNNMTANRAVVIANRAQSNEIGLIKAMMIETLKTKLANGIAHFTFIKKNGELREAWGTTQRNIANAKTNGRGESRELYKTTAFFDVEKGEWRSFRWETLVQVF